MMHIYGVTDGNGSHTDVSNSLLGAKQYATRNGYKRVSIRYNCGYICKIVAVKLSGGNWVSVKIWPLVPDAAVR